MRVQSGMSANNSLSGKNILIVGLPRSGTTWVQNVLGAAPNVEVIHEPDNEKSHPLGWRNKLSTHRFPYLLESDEDYQLENLFRTIFEGGELNKALSWRVIKMFSKFKGQIEKHIGEKTGFCYTDSRMNGVNLANSHKKNIFLKLFYRNIVDLSWSMRYKNKKDRIIIVKSVHIPLSTEWLSWRIPMKVVFVLRNPHSLYASYRRLRMPDGFRNLRFQHTLNRDWHNYVPVGAMLGNDANEAIVAQTCLMLRIIAAQINRHPEWIVVSHDRLCLNSDKDFRDIFQRIGFSWSTTIENIICQYNRPGEGFSINRIASEQPVKWKKQLRADEVCMIDEIIESWKINNFLHDFVY